MDRSSLLTENREHLSELQRRVEATRLARAVYSNVGFPSGSTDSILRQIRFACRGRRGRHLAGKSSTGYSRYRTNSGNTCNWQFSPTAACGNHYNCGEHAAGAGEYLTTASRGSPSRSFDTFQFEPHAQSRRRRQSAHLHFSRAKGGAGPPPPPSIRGGFATKPRQRGFSGLCAHRPVPAFILIFGPISEYLTHWKICTASMPLCWTA